MKLLLAKYLSKLDIWLVSRQIPYDSFSMGLPYGHKEQLVFFDHNRKLSRYAIACRKLAVKLRYINRGKK